MVRVTCEPGVTILFLSPTPWWTLVLLDFYRSRLQRYSPFSSANTSHNLEIYPTEVTYSTPHFRPAFNSAYPEPCFGLIQPRLLCFSSPAGPRFVPTVNRSGGVAASSPLILGDYALFASVRRC
ncbi:hypothetical protein CROQUDRAFT_91036 [Cronartium quercuum f. sp. fusiforme G11]|uniref:Uncharacterized protein n=1 Tax=Cronartium quercuum f. sp. fusiforme G11 TaxID=708437 RepID=A0A9P6TDF7_9BASI|nr:hypothetical protein CROQUDRAFT_91036 [Cronartium quercuum f. sp. fusiforme G11]